MNFEQILTKIDKILTISVNKYSMHVENVQGRHFLRKKKPAGMPTHRTGVDNIKNPLNSIKID